MGETIIDISRQFFGEIVRPVLEKQFPAETARTAFGIFGYGSDAMRLDDEYSRDHHWGLRIDALMPPEVFETRRQEMMSALSAALPATYRGHAIREGHVSGHGMAPESLDSFLKRTIGITHPPATAVEWLNIPEEDIVHVINGEVWHDPAGQFTAIRQKLSAYYPEPVHLRRIAHWCRYYSGFGSYALKRALLRNEEYFAAVAFGKAIRWGVQLAFLVEKQYFFYDKWIMKFLKKLPRLGTPMTPLVEEACRLSTSWERKLELLDAIADLLDATMVADGIIQPHPRFEGSATSGYRLMEHAYGEILQKLPADLREVVPQWDQIYMEKFVCGYVNGLDLPHWDSILNLKPFV